MLPAYDVTINFDDVECLKVKPCERAQNRREKFSRERVRQLVEHLRGDQYASFGRHPDRQPLRGSSYEGLRNIKTRLYAAAARGDRPRPVITSVQLVDLGTIDAKAATPLKVDVIAASE